MAHEIYLEQEVGSRISLLNALDISWEKSKARRSYLFLLMFIGIIRGKKLLFEKNRSFLRLVPFVKP